MGSSCRRRLAAGFFVAAAILAPAGFAGIDGSSGEVSVVSSPQSVRWGGTESAQHAFAFRERPTVVLPRDVRVDVRVKGLPAGSYTLDPGKLDEKGLSPTSGLLPMGACVNSHIVHADSPGADDAGVTYSGSVTFDTRIVGIAAIAGNLNASNFLGALNTDYPTDPRRDYDFTTDRNENAKITISANRRTVHFETTVYDHVDQFRVITACPPRLTVTKTPDRATVPEPGGVVTFEVTVTNQSPGTLPLQLTGIADSDFGSLDYGASSRGWIASSCAVGQAVPDQGKYTCEFMAMVSGEPGSPLHQNTVTVRAEDTFGQEAADTASATVGFSDVLPTIRVVKEADPQAAPEGGADVRFTVTVKNLSVEPVRLDTLVDDVFGNLNGRGTCATGGWIAVRASYGCSFVVRLDANAGAMHRDTVSATARDDEGNVASDLAFATVVFTDVPPRITVTKSAAEIRIDEPGGPVSYVVTVENRSVEAVRLASLVDDRFGDLDGRGTCAAGGEIARGAIYTCAFTAPIAGDAGETHTNVVTGTATDDEGNSATDDDDAAVTFLDVRPSLAIEKLAATTSVDEPGATVTYEIRVSNTSVESVRLSSLVDDRFGDLNGRGTCATGGSIAVSETYTCRFEAAIAGDAFDVHTNTVTGTVQDNESNSASASDDASVRFLDVKPRIRLTKSASSATVPATGGTITFTIRVDNFSVEPVSLTTLTDTVYGNLDGRGTCVIPQTIGVGSSYSCSFEAVIEGVPWIDHENTATGTAADNERNETSSSDSERVDVIVPPATGCKVTYGGQIVAANGDPASFGGNAMPAPRGQEQFQDHGPASPMNVHSISVASVFCLSATRAAIFGSATIGGGGSYGFRIDLQDLGEPGRQDTYRLRLDTGYDTTEKQLVRGNVQIHSRS